jgi:hypothetical protein
VQGFSGDLTVSETRQFATDTVTSEVDVCYIRDMDNSSIFRMSANVRESLFFHNRPETRMNTKRPFFDGISDGISGGETSGTQYSCGVHRLVDN